MRAIHRRAVPMTFAWLFPWGLAGLAALAVPLLLHLARRREHRILRFAAMRWLPAGRAPRRRLRLRERRLLALRLLLLAIAALWLAQPLLQHAGGPQRWLAVAPSVDPTAAQRAARDFDNAVWLVPGLPAVGDPLPRIVGPSGHASARWTSLLQEFATRLPADDTATVLVPDVVTGLGDRLPTLSRRLAWREVPAAQRTEAAPRSNAASQTGAAPRSDAESHTDAVPPPRLLALRYTAADSPALPWLRAAIAAWDQDPLLRVHLDEAPSTTPVPAETSAVLWMGPLPEPTRLPNLPLLQIHTDRPLPSPPGRGAGGEGPISHTPSTTPATTPLPTRPLADTRVPEPPSGHASTQPITNGQRTAIPSAASEWRTLADPLHPSTLPALYEPAFPRRLHATLFGITPPQRVPAARLRELPITAPAAYHGHAALSPRGLRELALSPLLAWLLLALFLLERWLASGRRLGRAP